MKIDAMVVREDFYSILANTLQYYFETQGVDGVVSYTGTGSECEQVMYIYPKINVICRRFPSVRIIRYILSEFNIRNRCLINMLAKAYVLLCLLTGGALASKKLYLTKAVFDRDTLIFPCNRKIRIFKFRLGYVDNVVKYSFTDRYFKNELDFRLSCNGNICPSILAYGSRWYREKILAGQPLARVRSDECYRIGIDDAMSAINSIAKATLTYENAHKYIDSLVHSIKTGLILANNRKNIKTFLLAERITNIAHKKALAIVGDIPLCCSHGDLQTGNIWFDSRQLKTYLIDWETHARRTIWYDRVTLGLSTRRKDKVARMINNCTDRNVRNIIASGDDFTYEMEAVMGILLLEDIQFYLEDMLELPFDFGGEIFDRIISEYHNIKWVQCG